MVHLLSADGSSCQHGESHLQSKTELRLSFCQKKIDMCGMLSSPLIVLFFVWQKIPERVRVAHTSLIAEWKKVSVVSVMQLGSLLYFTVCFLGVSQREMLLL